MLYFNRIVTPLNPPYKGGKQEKFGSLSFIRGGLGWGKKIFDTSIMTFQTSSEGYWKLVAGIGN